METMHAAGRRRLPPVPRRSGDRPATGQLTIERPRRASADQPPPTDTPRPEPVVAAPAPAGPAADAPLAEDVDTELIDTRQIAAELIEAELAALTAAAPAVGPADPETAQDTDEFPDGSTIRTAPPEGDGDTDPDDTAQDETAQSDAAQDDTEQDDTEQIHLPELATEDATAADATAEVASHVAAAEVAGAAHGQSIPAPRTGLAPDQLPAEPPVDEQDPAQMFVARLRSSAVDFAGAAGAESAVVREAVPPARHRRARCRLVLRYADGDVADVTLLGPAGRPGRPSRHGFDRQILRWLGAGLVRDDAWLVPDPDAPDGTAVDLTAWVAAG